MPEDYPRCEDCGRTASERIDVRGVRWEPDLEEVRPGVFKCFWCRGEPHPDMHLESIKQKVND